MLIAMERSVDARFSFCWRVVVAVLLLRFSCGLPTAVAQSQSDFLNIDCGATETSVDGLTNFTWVPDDAYISGGKTHTFATEGTTVNDLLNFIELKTIRYFDDPRPKKFCFTLPVVSGNAYLLRATYFYGNYDNKNQTPSFQMALDATVLDNVTAVSTGGTYSEYNYVANGNVTYLCLLRTSPQHSPLISGISLKMANKMVTDYVGDYAKYLQQGVIMNTVGRVNFGATELIRAPDDYYDRFWWAESLDSGYLTRTVSPMQILSTNSTFVNYVHSASGPPSSVLQTGITSSGVITSLLLPPGYGTLVKSSYLAAYFGELNSTISTGSPTRKFTIQVHGLKDNSTLDGTFLDLDTHEVWSTGDFIIGPDSTMTLTPLADSVAGPILNAMEFFEKSKTQLDKTTSRDAMAIEDIKKDLKLMEWSGDPCLPVPHSWITCSPSSRPQVTAVNLSGYQLETTIPASFASLFGLTALILDSNNFSGPLPAWLTTLPNLRTLSIRNNNFSGPVPDALLSTNSLIQFEYRPGNLLLTGKGGSPSGSPDGKSSSAAIVGAIVGGVAGLTFIVAIAIVAYSYRYQLQRKVPKQSDDEGTSMMKIATPGAAKAFSLAEVKVATSNFNKELGRGGFGPVYYGKFLDGQEVAVKVADGSSKQGDKEFFNEVDVLSRVHHKNLVALLGYCQGQKPILIYEFMHNGSLFDHLHGTSSRVKKLDWRTRLRIALNAAQGLEYLHTGCNPSFIHRDVKSNNILLTSKLDAKVADFGLTKLMREAEDTRVITDVMGTAGYLDPEYYTTQYLSSKSDVYSFGIVLLELITGRLPIDQSTIATKRNPHIVHWVRESLLNSDIDSILDPTLKGSNPYMEAIWKVVDVAMQSVEPKGVHRPTMLEVVQELQGALTIEGIRMSPLQTPLHSNFSNNSSNFQHGLTSYPKPV